MVKRVLEAVSASGKTQSPDASPRPLAQATSESAAIVGKRRFTGRLCLLLDSVSQDRTSLLSSKVSA